MATTDNAIAYDIKIVEHLLEYLDFSEEQAEHLLQFVKMGIIQRDRIVEEAIAKCAGYEITSIVGQDFCDGSDAKSVTGVYRNNNKAKGAWMHSFRIPSIQAKTGILRVIAYNRLLDEFYYFAIPNDMYNNLSVVEITVESYTHYGLDAPFDGRPRKHTKWWAYECATFEEMACKQF